MDRYSLVYRGAPPDITCCDQTLRILPNGEWMVLFMTGGITEPEVSNHVVLCRSGDEGETWGLPEPVMSLPDRACLLSEVYWDGDGWVMLAATHAGYFDDWHVWTVKGDALGRHWDPPQPFTPLPRRAFVRNRCITSTGEWLLPFQTYDTMPDPQPSPLRDGSIRSAFNGVLISSDQGATWDCSNRVGPTAGFAENNVVELRNGALVMLIRADGQGCLLRSDSHDRGHTWSQPERTAIPNPGSKFRLWRISDGRILLIHNPNSRTSHPNSKGQSYVNRNPLALWISEDDMATWGYQRVLTDFPGMLAYPDGEPDAEERWLHFAFEYNRHDVIYWGVQLPPAGSR
jgi:predicted neuraminidase